MSLHPLEESETLRIDDLSKIPTVKKPENRQVFAGNEPSEYSQSSLRLTNDHDPNLKVVREKPEHRLMVYLKLSGKTNSEIAELMGYTLPWVGQICRQPWFRQKFVELADEEGRDAAEAFLQGEVLTSIDTLCQIRDDPTERGSTKVAAVKELLDRALGKSIQTVKTENRNIRVDDEVDRLNKEIESLNASLNAGAARN